MSLDLFKRFILRNVNNIKISKNIKITGSFIELLDVPRYQSICIKLGTIFERSINYYINNNEINVDNMITIHPKINNKQIDCIFKKDNTIYYFEIKNNINLDTEKSKAVYDKVLEIEKYLKNLYPESKIISGILTMRFSNRDIINRCNIVKKPIDKLIIYGYTDFFSIFNLDMDEEYFMILINNIKEILKIKLADEQPIQEQPRCEQQRREKPIQEQPIQVEEVVIRRITSAERGEYGESDGYDLAFNTREQFWIKQIRKNLEQHVKPEGVVEEKVEEPIEIKKINQDLSYNDLLKHCRKDKTKYKGFSKIHNKGNLKDFIDKKTIAENHNTDINEKRTEYRENI